MILTNYYISGFLIACISIMYVLIIYFNYNAIRTTLDNKILKISSPPPACDYKDAVLIANSDVCTKGDNNGLYYITLGNNSYSLSTIQKNYLNVCKNLCDNYDSLSGECTGDNIQKDNFNSCVNDLKPGGGCSDLEKALGFRYDSNNESVYFYAKDIIQINSCI